MSVYSRLLVRPAGIFEGVLEYTFSRVSSERIVAVFLESSLHSLKPRSLL